MRGHTHTHIHNHIVGRLIEICHEENGFVKTEWGLQER